MHQILHKVEIIVVKMQLDWTHRYDLSILGSVEVQEMQTYTLNSLTLTHSSIRRHCSSKRSETSEGLRGNWTTILLLPLICKKMEKTNVVTLFRRDNILKKYSTAERGDVFGEAPTQCDQNTDHDTHSNTGHFYVVSCWTIRPFYSARTLLLRGSKSGVWLSNMATVLTDEERNTSKVGHMQAIKAYSGDLRYSSIGTDGDR